MDKLREAARQALKDWDKRNPLDEAMNLMEEALAEQAEQKPVAIDELARACNLAGIEYKDFLRIKAHLPIVAPVQQVEQEPVAWMEDSIELYVSERPSNTYTIPLYAAPVSAEAIRAESLEEAAKVCRTAQAKGLQSIREAIEAAIRRLK